MVSRNNLKEKIRQMEEKKERFSIRKFTIGAASVLIGFTFLGLNAQSAKAETIDQVALKEQNKTENNNKDHPEINNMGGGRRLSTN